MESLYDRISKGTISVDEITASMERSTSAGGKYFQSMEKQSQTVSGQLSTLKDNFQQLVGEVFAGASGSIGDSVLPLAIGWVEQLSTAFAENGVEGLSGALGTILAELAGRAAESAPQLINLAVGMIQSLVTGLTTNAPTVGTAASSIFASLANGILSLLPMLPPLAFELLMTFGQGLASQAPSLVQSAAQVIADLITYFASHFPEFVTMAGELIAKIAYGLVLALPTLVGAVPELINGLLSAFSNLLFEFIDIGANIVHGIWDGIMGAKDWLVDKISGFASGIVSSVKDFFGIHSPSKVMKDEVGQWLAKGIAVGFEEHNPMLQIQKTLDVGVRGLQNSLFGNMGTTTNNQTNNFYGIRTPDQVARDLRLAQNYGLAGAY